MNSSSNTDCTNFEIINKIHKLAMNSFNLQIKHKNNLEKVGELLKRFGEDIEENIRYHDGFLVEMMDYGNGIWTKESIKEEIEQAIKEEKDE